MYIDGPWEYFAKPQFDAAHKIRPNLFLYGWLAVSRLLNSAQYLKEYNWDPRGTFLLFENYRRGQQSSGSSDVLVAYSNDENEFEFPLWTGGHLNAFDILGNKFELKYSSDNNSISINVGPLPIFIENFPTNRVETAFSMKRSSGAMDSRKNEQELHYKLINSLQQEMEVQFEMEPPPGWRVTPPSYQARVAPGKSADVHWKVSLPSRSQILRHYPFKISLDIVSEDQSFPYQFIDKIPLGSDLIELNSPPNAPEDDYVTFQVKNLSADTPLRLNLFYRVFPDAYPQISKIFKNWSLAAGGQSELKIILPFAVGELIGEKIWVGYQVMGRGDINTFEFEGLEKNGEIHFVPE